MEPSYILNHAAETSADIASITSSSVIVACCNCWPQQKCASSSKHVSPSAGWAAILTTEESSRLCACLMLAAPLAAAAACLQSHLNSMTCASPVQLAAVDKVSYPALSAAVIACQMQTAQAVEGQSFDLSPTEALKCFWACDTVVSLP